VADVGAGSGLFTRLFAAEVGKTGRVYAVDIAREFVEGNLRRAREQGHQNVIGIESSQEDTRLPAASVDLVFICDAYHHFEQPQAMLGSIRRALRPGGTLVVVDFERIPGVSPEWIVKHVRAGKEQFRAEIEAAGLRFVEEVKLMRENYFLRFSRD
jgi:ubiquinone/menaquinone biosynthesis C-methylase UbiE